MPTHLFTENEIMEQVSGWKFRDNGIELEIKFTDFIKAFSFMTGIALMAEKADHHPEWSNVYNKVKIRWSTHSAGGVTVKDIKMAKAINEMIKSI